MAAEPPEVGTGLFESDVVAALAEPEWEDEGEEAAPSSEPV
ncbi:MAG: hypothetical protein ABUL49_00450 [bacterium]